MKRFCKRLIIGGLILVAACLVVIRTHSFQQWLLRRAEVIAREAGFPVTAATIRLNFSELKAHLEGVAYDHGQQHIEVETLDLDFPWRVLRDGSLHITSIEASGVVARLNATSPAPTVAATPAPATSPMRVHVERIAIRNASLIVTRDKTVLTIPSISIEANAGQGVIRLDDPIEFAPGSQVAVRQIPFDWLDDRLHFGPARWDVRYEKYAGSGSAEGELRWVPEVALTAEIATEPLSIESWRGIRAAARISYGDGALNVSEFRASHGSGELRGSARLSESGNSADLLWKGVRLEPFGLSAGTHGALTLQWQDAQFRDISGDGNIVVNSKQYGTAYSKVRVTNSEATFDVRANPMDVALQARITTGMNGDLRGTYHAVYRKIGVADLQGAVSGTIWKPAATGQLRVTDVFYGGYGPATASARGTLSNNVITLEDLRAAIGESSSAGSTLQVNLSDRTLRGEIPVVDAALQDFLPDLHGVARLSARIRGTIDRPSAEFDGAATGIEVYGNSIDSARFHGRFADGAVELTQFEARQSNAVFNASGMLEIATGNIQAEAQVSDFKVARIPEFSAIASMQAKVGGSYRSPDASFSGELRDTTFKGTDHGTIRIEGTSDRHYATAHITAGKYSTTAAGYIRLEAPYPFSADLIANSAVLQYDRYEFTADGKLQVSAQAQPFRAQQVHFDNFMLAGEGVALSADGSLHAGVRVSAEADLSKLPINEADLEGKATVLATVSGSIDDPIVEGVLRTDGASLRVPAMRDAAGISAEVDFTGRDFSVKSLKAGYAGATAAITGRGSWLGKGQFEFQVDNLRPENFLTGRPVSGLASITGEVDVQSPSLDGISAKLRVPDLMLNVRDVEIRQSRPIEADIASGTLVVKSLELEGLDTHAAISGSVGLLDRALNLEVDADTDLTILEALLPDVSPDGQLQTRVTVRGTADKPLIDGFADLADGELAFDSLNLDGTGIAAHAEFRGNQIELKRASGELNGGAFEASGEARVTAAGLQEATINLKLDRTPLEYPPGLQTEVSSELKLSGTAPTFTLSGKVDVLSGLYEERFNLTRQVFGRISTAQSAFVIPVDSGLTDRIRMEVDVNTSNPVIINNNVADIEVTGSFRVRGTAARPIILGRATVEEGGELYFGPASKTEDIVTGKRPDRYVITHGAIDFTNSLRTEPEFDFLATHELNVGDEAYLVTLTATGTPDNLKTELTSDPPQSQQDIVTMLLTGRSFQDLQGEYATFAGEQALNYVSGRVSEQVLSQAGNVLGLSMVRVDPVTVADQTDLAARLTIGKDFTKDLSLVYSQRLDEAKAQTWTVEYDLFDRFSVRGVNDAEKKSFLFDLRHDLEFGSGTARRSGTRKSTGGTLRDVTFSGTQFSHKELSKRVTRKGQPVRANQINSDARNLRRYFASKDFPSARIQVQQTSGKGGVIAHFAIVEGPKTSITYEGLDVPEDVRTDIQQLWMTGRSEARLLRSSRERLLRYVRSENYLLAQVSYEKIPATGVDRQFVFKIEPGNRFETPKWVFKGVQPLDIREKAGVVMENPDAIKSWVETHFRNGGYLDATSSSLTLVFREPDAHFEVTVDLGKQYVVGDIRFDGIAALSDMQLRSVILPESLKANPPPVPFTSEWLETARQRIVSQYWKNGFNDVQIDSSIISDNGTARASILFKVDEGNRQVVEAIEIDGAAATSLPYIQSQFEFKKGDPVDYEKIHLTRKYLYDTRRFKLVDIQMAPGQGTGYIARVHLTENKPWRLKYGFAVTEYLDSTDRALGFSVDLSYNNLFRRGVLLGGSAKANADERDIRMYSSVSGIFGRNVKSSLTLFATRDQTNPTEIADFWGGTVQQQWEIGRHYIVSYDYSYRRVRTEDLQLPADSFDQNPRVPIARFNTSVSRDTRDDILNATRGSFISNSFEVAPPGIGSSIEYFRNYSQFLRFQRLNSRMVWASGFRIGVAEAFGDQELDSTIQFVAGGGTTVRGFRQGLLTPEPGDSVLILNQEMRFHVLWKIHSVGFLDIGQVSQEAKALIKLPDLRYGAGVGLRFETPFVFLRTDYGVNLKRRPGEPASQFSFGIGQAF